MTQSFKLNIADTIFSFTAEQGVSLIKDIAPYNLFLAEGRPEVTLRYKYGSYWRKDMNSSKEIIFDSHPTWRLFYFNKKYILETRTHTLVVSPDFTSGDVYLDKKSGNYPFVYPLDEVLMINLLGKGRGVFVHACGVNNNGSEGLLFAGTSRAGKSTIANLWKCSGMSADKSQQLKVKDTTILSDDRIIIRKMAGRFWIYGTPWHGDAKACSPEKSPLKKIFFLEHASENYVRDIKRVEAMSKFLVRSFPPFWDSEGMEFTLKFIEEVTGEIPCYDLGFLPDKSAINFIKNI